MDPQTAVVVGSAMDAQAVVAIAAAVVALTQLIKQMGVAAQRGPLVVLGVSLLGVGVWVWSHGVYSRASAFDILAAFIATATSAAGIWGFARSGPAALTSLKDPPPGAMANEVSPITPPLPKPLKFE